MEEAAKARARTAEAKASAKVRRRTRTQRVGIAAREDTELQIVGGRNARGESKGIGNIYGKSAKGRSCHQISVRRGSFCNLEGDAQSTASAQLPPQLLRSA
eukprot:4211305-Pyramimonas_sp.AAC.1